MESKNAILEDSFGRKHDYLRISLTERCNLRCTYCMPENGVELSPPSHLMTADEIYNIAKIFVKNGVSKIRLTGGEPLVRKDFALIIQKLATLPVTLAMSSNAVQIDKYIEILKEAKLKKINVSLDTLNAQKFKEITFRAHFEVVYNNIMLLLKEGFEVKINAVIMKGVNDNEIIDFIEFTKKYAVNVRFIEFMPFLGNKWNKAKTVSLQEMLHLLEQNYGKEQIVRLEDSKNDTAKNYKIENYLGQFAIISTVTNPFCDSCNRLRLTANGQIKNCLFSSVESNILGAYRNNENIEKLIEQAVKGKFLTRAGMNSPESFENFEQHQNNRSMITIGG